MLEPILEVTLPNSFFFLSNFISFLNFWLILFPGVIRRSADATRWTQIIQWDRFSLLPFRKSPVTILVLFENLIDEDEYGSIMLASVLVWNLESYGVMN